MPEKLETKAFVGFEIKDEAQGLVEAIFATIGVVDLDGDIIRPGAIEDGAVVTISDYGHNAIFGDRPVGKGRVVIDGNKALVKGQLFLDTTDGRDAFNTLRGMGKDQQWSFGFETIGSEVPSDADRKKGAMRILTKLDAFEVSPVIRGAGIGTRTTVVKSADAQPEEDATVVAAREEAAKLAAREMEIKNTAASRAAMRELERFRSTQRRLGRV